MSTPRVSLTLIQQLLYASKLFLKKNSYACTHATVLADAMSQWVRLRAWEKVPLNTFDLEKSTNRRANENKLRVQTQIVEYEDNRQSGKPVDKRA